jgi:hypothetical protein
MGYSEVPAPWVRSIVVCPTVVARWVSLGLFYKGLRPEAREPMLMTPSKGGKQESGPVR